MCASSPTVRDPPEFGLVELHISCGNLGRSRKAVPDPAPLRKRGSFSVMSRAPVATRSTDVADLFNQSQGPGVGGSKNDTDLFSFPAIRRRQTDAELLAELRAFGKVYAAEDRTMQNYRRWSQRRFHEHTIISQLGSWVGALKQAGLSHDTRRRDAPTKAEVEVELRKFASATPVAERTLANFKTWRLRRISLYSVTHHFGNWHDALLRLGITVPRQTRSVKNSDEEILERIPFDMAHGMRSSLLFRASEICPCRVIPPVRGLL